VRGKLIRKSLKTDVLSVAKLRLADLEKLERQNAETQTKAAHGRLTFGEAVTRNRTIEETDRHASQLGNPSPAMTMGYLTPPSPAPYANPCQPS